MKKSALSILTFFVAASAAESSYSQPRNENKQPVEQLHQADLNKPVIWKDEKHSKSTWDNFTSTLNNVKLKYKIEAPTLDLAKGMSLGGSYKANSSPSIGDKYSGIDVWEVNLKLMPDLLGFSNFILNPSLTASRQVTYIQQFNTRKESLIRLEPAPILWTRKCVV